MHWSWQGQTVTLGIDEAGDGAPVLLLPALSSISTRREMRSLMQLLAAAWHVIVPDWPGFGDQPRPAVSWTPDALSAFLEHFVRHEAPALHATVAAGHAATYALHLAAQRADALGRLALLAPTWRGPLPTMAGGDRPLFHRLRRLVDAPIVGPLLYRANVNRVVVRMMTAGHVYSGKDVLSGELWGQKQDVIRAPGARFGSVAFVTGGLDRAKQRAEFLALAGRARRPFLVVYGSETPPRSRMEMEMLARLPEVESVVLTHGKLAFYEEFPADLLPHLSAFLR